MKSKLTLAVIAVILAPSFAAAMCSSQHEQAMSCGEGMAWDHEKQTCVEQVTG